MEPAPPTTSTYDWIPSWLAGRYQISSGSLFIFDGASITEDFRLAESQTWTFDRADVTVLFSTDTWFVYRPPDAGLLSDYARWIIRYDSDELWYGFGKTMPKLWNRFSRRP